MHETIKTALRTQHSVTNCDASTSPQGTMAASSYMFSASVSGTFISCRGSLQWCECMCKINPELSILIDYPYVEFIRSKTIEISGLRLE